jgi:hypothetical protein
MSKIKRRSQPQQPSINNRPAEKKDKSEKKADSQANGSTEQKPSKPRIRDSYASGKGGKASKLTRGGAPTDKSSANAIRMYRKLGNTPLQIASSNPRRAQKNVLTLISRSPQIDALKNTKNDAYRCGAACVFNALLLDGNPRQNSAAIAGLVADSKYKLSVTEKHALDAMAKGRMSPNDAAYLQDLLFKVARHRDSRKKPTEHGLDVFNLTDLVTALRRKGGFSRTKSLEFQNYDRHWTLTQVGKDGQTYVDPLPKENGKADIVEGDPAQNDKSFVARVLVDFKRHGSKLTLHCYEKEPLKPSNLNRRKEVLVKLTSRVLKKHPATVPVL